MPTSARRLAGPSRPLGVPEIPQFRVPPVQTPAAAGRVWVPWLYGAARVRFVDRRRRIDETRHVAFRLPLFPAPSQLDWEQAQAVDIRPGDLLPPDEGAGLYAPLPDGAMDLQTFTRWARAFDRWLARTQRWSTAGSAPAPEETPGEGVALAPKRGGVSVDLVAIVWDAVSDAR